MMIFFIPLISSSNFPSTANLPSHDRSVEYTLQALQSLKSNAESFKHETAEILEKLKTYQASLLKELEDIEKNIQTSSGEMGANFQKLQGKVQEIQKHVDNETASHTETPADMKNPVISEIPEAAFNTVDPPTKEYKTTESDGKKDDVDDEPN